MPSDTPKLAWQHAWDYGIETGRYMLVGELGGDWKDAVLEMGPNFGAAPLHPDPRIAAEQQILDNMVRGQAQRRTDSGGNGEANS
jgi:hypothetical protein